LFVKETIIILINERYYDAIPVVGVIVIGVYFSSLLTITNSFLGFEKKFGTTSKIASVAAVSNIALNIILIPDWGIMGAAMATLISYLLYLVIGVVAVKSYITILRFIPVFLYTSIYLIAVCVSLMVFASNEIRSYEIFLKVVVLITFVTGLFTFRIVKTTDIKKIKSLILKK
jgi:O-antigen/teichoic acid export membrane protein